VFNNTGRLSKDKFVFNGNHITNEKKYTYLGVTFSASGSFTDGKTNLYKKASKAFFKLKKYFSDLKPNVKTLLHLFDHTIKPILLYGSEIWGAFPAKKLVAKDDTYFYKLCKDLITEKAHIKYCKYVLQVPRRAANLTVMAELGRYPILLEVFLNMIKFWVRLTKENNSLLHNAFEESKTSAT